MVKEGYKETEIGVIPEDWGLSSAKNLMNIETGSRNTEHKSNNGKYLFFVRSQQVEHIDSYHYDCEAVLTAGDGVGTGKVFHYINGKFDAHQRVYVMSQFKDISGKFFYNYFKENFGNEVSKYTAKSSVDSVRRDMIAEMLIPIPSLEEQQKIAEALSDMDNLISSLEKLIEKKKAIKQACLQKMFPKEGESVPKMRLPGFSDAWEQRKLGDVGQTYTGLAGKTKDDFGHGQAQFITYMNVFSNPVANPDMTEPIEIDQKQNEVEIGDVFFTTSSETPEEVGMASVLLEKHGKTYLNSFCFGYRPTEKFDSYFLAYMLRSKTVRDKITLLAQGISRYNISKNKVMEISVSIPSLDEQAAIGAFFNRLDHLITLHQRKLEKCRKIKQGMMQQLLTGKIRLTSVVNTAINEPKSETVKVHSNGHNHQFDDAVVIAGIVDKFYSDRFPLGRKKVQKLLYLFRRHQKANTSAFKKKAAGPYADAVRYKGGEHIAIKNKYVSVKCGIAGSSFSKGEKIANALSYLKNWELNDDLKWLCEQFRFTKTDKLELLATIDMAMCDLENEGVAVTVDSIKNLIKSHDEWKAKLSKSYFRDMDIAWAIKECKRLFN